TPSSTRPGLSSNAYAILAATRRSNGSRIILTISVCGAHSICLRLFPDALDPEGKGTARVRRRCPSVALARILGAHRRDSGENSRQLEGKALSQLFETGRLGRCFACACRLWRVARSSPRLDRCGRLVDHG